MKSFFYYFVLNIIGELLFTVFAIILVILIIVLPAHIWVLVLLGIFLALAGGYYLVLPMTCRSSMISSKNTEIIEFLPEETPPPGDAANYLDEAHKDLTNSGFARLSTSLLPAPLPNCCNVVAIYLNEATTDLAVVIIVWGVAEGIQPILSRCVEFRSEYKDMTIETSSNIEISPYKIPDNLLLFRFPSLTSASSISMLYDHHQILCEHHAPNQAKHLELVDAFQRDVPAYLNKIILEKDLDNQVKHGLYKFDKSSDKYIPTIIGTYLIPWCAMQPFKAFFQARNRILEKKLLRDISNEFLS